MAIINVGKADFDEKVINSGKKTLVEFWAPWCVYCKRLSPVLDRLAAKLGDEYPIAKVNVDEDPELEDKYGIELLPTIVLFDGENVVDKLQNPPSQVAIESWIAEKR